MSKFVIVSYYTKDTIYEKLSQVFTKTCVKYGVPYYLERIKSRGSWEANVNYKPTFLKRMLIKFAPEKANVVWVDCDATFHTYPDLFRDVAWDFGVPTWQRNRARLEILSGTLFLRNCHNTRQILNAWEKECQENPKQWDQKSLAAVLEFFPYHDMPLEYCKIFDRMRMVTDPVIEHHQASREVRKRNGALT